MSCCSTISSRPGIRFDIREGRRLGPNYSLKRTNQSLRD